MSSYAEYEAAKAFVGKTGLLHAGKLRFAVQIKDVTFKYGNLRYLVTPIAGSGEIWAQKVEIPKTKKTVADLDNMIVYPTKQLTSKPSKGPN